MTAANSPPPELLTEISKYIEGNDYKTLYSCILVNKQWHRTNLPNLWKNSFYSVSSTKILINCLLAEEDRDFLKRNKIQLNFKLLKKQPPLHNYASFMTELDFNKMNAGINGLLLDTCVIRSLTKRLLEFILDHSFNIKTLGDFDPDYTSLFIDHDRFELCFQTLYELDSVNFNSDCCDFLEKLSNTCRTIQILKIRYDDSSDSDKAVRSLALLIKAQHKIKELVVNVYGTLILSDDFRKAISIHSNSIIYFQSNNIKVSNSLIPMFPNLEALTLHVNSKNIYNFDTINFQRFFLRNLQVLCLELHQQLYLSDLSDFINDFNGKNVKDLRIRGTPNDIHCLGNLVKSIEQNCKNLEHLEIFYNNQVNHELTCIFNNCTRLKHITLSGRYVNGVNVGEVFNILNQTLPKSLNTICFNHGFSSDEDALGALIRNWERSKPLKIEFSEKW